MNYIIIGVVFIILISIVLGYLFFSQTKIPATTTTLDTKPDIVSKQKKIGKCPDYEDLYTITYFRKQECALKGLDSNKYVSINPT